MRRPVGDHPHEAKARTPVLSSTFKIPLITASQPVAARVLSRDLAHPGRGPAHYARYAPQASRVTAAARAEPGRPPRRADAAFRGPGPVRRPHRAGPGSRHARVVYGASTRADERTGPASPRGRTAPRAGSPSATSHAPTHHRRPGAPNRPRPCGAAVGPGLLRRPHRARPRTPRTAPRRRRPSRPRSPRTTQSGPARAPSAPCRPRQPVLGRATPPSGGTGSPPATSPGQAQSLTHAASPRTVTLSPVDQRPVARPQHRSPPAPSPLPPPEPGPLPRPHRTGPRAARSAGSLPRPRRAWTTGRAHR